MKRYLNFSEDFTERILNGRKRATLRLGKKDYRPGDRVIVRAGDRVLGEAVIRNVRVLRFSELTQRDVEIDGYDSRDELIKDLKKFYGNFKEDDIFTQIIFELIK